jgi:hypothetical protein
MKQYFYTLLNVHKNFIKMSLWQKKPLSTNNSATCFYCTLTTELWVAGSQLLSAPPLPLHTAISCSRLVTVVACRCACAQQCLEKSRIRFKDLAESATKGD